MFGRDRVLLVCVLDKGMIDVCCVSDGELGFGWFVFFDVGSLGFFFCFLSGDFVDMVG